MINIETMWYGNTKIERVMENDKITKVKTYYKHPNGMLEQIFWEQRVFHDNGEIKTIFNSHGERYEFDEEGNTIK